MYIGESTRQNSNNSFVKKDNAREARQLYALFVNGPVSLS